VPDCCGYCPPVSSIVVHILTFVAYLTLSTAPPTTYHSLLVWFWIQLPTSCVSLVQSYPVSTSGYEAWNVLKRAYCTDCRVIPLRCCASTPNRRGDTAAHPPIPHAADNEPSIIGMKWKYHGGNVSPVDGNFYAIPQRQRGHCASIPSRIQLLMLVNGWMGGTSGTVDWSAVMVACTVCLRMLPLYFASTLPPTIQRIL
jgi:hypothetical protein